MKGACICNELPRNPYKPKYIRELDPCHCKKCGLRWARCAENKGLTKRQVKIIELRKTCKKCKLCKKCCIKKDKCRPRKPIKPKKNKCPYNIPSQTRFMGKETCAHLTPEPHPSKKIPPNQKYVICYTCKMVRIAVFFGRCE